MWRDEHSYPEGMELLFTVACSVQAKTVGKFVGSRDYEWYCLMHNGCQLQYFSDTSALKKNC